MASRIRSDEEIFAEIKDKSRKAYQKCWKDFKDCNPEVNFEEAPPWRRMPDQLLQISADGERDGNIFFVDPLLLPE